MRKVILAMLAIAVCGIAHAVTPISSIALPVQTDPVANGDMVPLNFTVVNQGGSMVWIVSTTVCAKPDPALTDAQTLGDCRTLSLDATAILTGTQKTALRNLRKQIITNGAFTPTP